MISGGEKIADDIIEARLTQLQKSKFRRSFHLRPAEATYARARGRDMIEQHARDFIRERLAPEKPCKDGKQTPWGGHPVFRGQHATATCCRTCLARNHGIPDTRAVTDDEQKFLVALLMAWIEGELLAAPALQLAEKPPPAQPSLFH